MRAARRVAAVAVVVTATSLGPAGAATVPDLPASTLARAAWVASAATYRLEVTVEASALVQRDGTRIQLPRGHRRMVHRGGAFGVSTGGHLVAAAHVVDPRPQLSAIGLYRAIRGVSEEEARTWAVERFASLASRRVVSWQVSPIASVARWSAVPARRAEGGAPAIDTDVDAAVLLVADSAARSAPSLLLQTQQPPTGRPLAVVGVGGSQRDDGLPNTRLGEARGRARPDGSASPYLAVSVDIQAGDSGGPVVDGAGRAVGMVTRRRIEVDGEVQPAGAARASDLAALLASVGIESAPGPADRAFTQGMLALWRLDTASAREALTAATAAHPGHALAARGLARTRELEQATFRIAADPRGPSALWALAGAATLVAAALTMRLRRLLTPEAEADSVDEDPVTEPGEGSEEEW